MSALNDKPTSSPRIFNAFGLDLISTERVPRVPPCPPPYLFNAIVDQRSLHVLVLQSLLSNIWGFLAWFVVACINHCKLSWLISFMFKNFV